VRSKNITSRKGIKIIRDIALGLYIQTRPMMKVDLEIISIFIRNAHRNSDTTDRAFADTRRYLARSCNAGSVYETGNS